MTTVNRPNRDALREAVDIYIDAMRPFIIRNLRSVRGAKVEDLVERSLQDRQVSYFRQAMRNSGNNIKASIDSAYFPLIIRTHWREVFAPQFDNNPSAQNVMWQIKDARDSAEHRGELDLDYDLVNARLYDISDMLGRIRDQAAKDRVERIKNRLSAHDAAPSSAPLQSETEQKVANQRPTPQTSPRSSANLRPWREVIRPNADVSQGTFQEAEFAADLQQVRDGRANATQYGNPVSFFNHTYITPGIRALLVNTLKRLSNNGGDPVIQTKTGFGGGKTHSLIALYHLVKNASALVNPSGSDSGQTGSEIRGIMDEAGFDSDQENNVAVLVGTFLSTTDTNETDAGDPLNTLWGEMAYQLDGQEAYDIVGEAARRGTAPGGRQLDELFRRVAPCVILMDELVAYVRNAGDMRDNIYTFMQNLTEAARRNERVSLVVTLPESAVEAGGQGGEEALARLDSILGRIEATWEPLEISEAFEVVRRRLFGSVIDREAIERTCEAFSRMYSNNLRDYPHEAGQSRYLDRMKACYPIHPEIFERLYSDWSSIHRFQRTRGVLRMMANCISRLDLNQDTSPLIMPANLTMDDPGLSNEFINILGEQWRPVFSEADSDGSRTDLIDKSSQRFNRFGGVSRRLARAILLGSAPAGAVRGIDASRIRLAVTQPGHGVSVYNDVLSRMAGDLYYLYRSDNRYYFHIEENLNKVAADRAGQLAEREVTNEIRRVMGEAVGRRSDVIVFPHNSGEAPDTDTVRLVILPPDKSLSNRASERDEATPEALDILQNRADAGRIHKNTLLFLAPRKDEARQLRRAIRDYLAWNSIQRGDRRIENLEGDRRRQVTNSVRQYESEVRSALVNTYRWVIAPYQSNPQDSTQFDMQPWQISSSDTGEIVQAAFDKCIEEEALVDSLSPDALQSMLQQYIWNSDRDHLSVDELWKMMTSYVYMHRLRNMSVLLDCIESGVSESKEPKFGYAEGYNSGADSYASQYNDLRFGEPTGDDKSAIAERGHGLLVNPEMALLVKEEQEERRRKEVLPGPPSEVEPDGPGSQKVVVDPPVVDPTPSVTRIIVNQTFHGEIDLNDISQLNAEIIRNITTDGGSVTISLTVSANNPDGFSENIVRSIRENCDQLGLDFEQA